MGVYNTITIKNFLCPYGCGEKSDVEVQTKDGEDICMNRYNVGDKYDNGQFKFIEGIGSCESLMCQLESSKESVWDSGYYGGFSRSFDVRIYLDNKGRITNKVKLLHLNNHKGIMYGKLGELPSNQNYQYKGHWIGKGKNKKWFSKRVRLTTNGWLDKFQEDKTRYFYDTGKPVYRAIMYLFNLKDGEEAFKLWFIFRNRFNKIIKILTEQFKLKGDEEFASIFLSNSPEDIYKLGEDNER
jgi:hypothetical protein